ncbi:uncharacterized protein [Drosophila tropicalis]|uniref:uncharacterized protein n=1 Tax=Drosophila tropicalis TaxID=46794 RepID=UPI0035ABCD25
MPAPVNRLRRQSTSAEFVLFFSIFISVNIFCHVSAQDTSSYYFPSQNRFVPSSGSFPRQSQSSLSGFRGSNSGGFSPSPGSYQEQLLFIANENGQKQPTSALAGNSPYGGSSFGAVAVGGSGGGLPTSQFAAKQPNRQSDYYDISPRPFGVPVGGGSSGLTSASASAATLANGFTRSKAIRNGSGSGGSGNSLTGGFQPQAQRINVPHQQTQFLAHFSETTNDKQRLPSSSRPFGNGGGFSPTRTRSQAPVTTITEAAATSSAAAVQPYRSRNRFQSQPSSTTVSSTTTGSSNEVSSKRYNRFGSNRSKTTTSTTQNTPSERPSFGRKSPNPRRPVFISREVNEPVSLVSKRPFTYNSARLKLPRPTSSTTSTTESLEEEELEEEEEAEEHEGEEESSEQDDHSEASSLEKLPLQEEITSTSKYESSTSASLEQSSPIILTSNFYLPDGSRLDAAATNTTSDKEPEKNTLSTEEDAQTESLETTEGDNDVTTLRPVYEYEYVGEDDEATTAMPPNNESTEEEHPEVENITTEMLPVETSSTSTTEKPKETEDSHNQEEDSQSEYDDEEGSAGDDEYEYDEEDSEGTDEEDATNESEPAAQHEDDREIISVVTTKSVVNGSTAYPAPVTPSTSTTTLGDSQPAPKLEEEEQKTEPVVINTTPLPENQSTPNVTESYVVVASIQTSRSINGARFLPFPAIEQEETKQTLSELERKVHSKQQQQKPMESSEEPPTTTPTTTTTTTSSSSSIASASVSASVGASTESIIDKLDRVQSELSSGLLSGKYPIISQMDASTPATSTTVGAGSGKFVPHIRKFQPKTTSAPTTTSSGSKLKVQHFDESEMDELAGLLPVGFKPKSSYKNRKITTTTTTTTTELPSLANLSKKPGRNSTISRSFKNGLVTVQDVALAGLLPKGYKPPRTTPSTTKRTTTANPDESTAQTSSALESLFSGIKFDDSLAALLPKDYKLSTTTPPSSAPKEVDDLSKFLPPGYKQNKNVSTTTARSPPVAVPFDDLSKFLPPGYKAPKEKKVEAESKLPLGVTPIKLDDLSDLLPPGFKLNQTDKGKDELPESLLPPGYKSKGIHPASTSTSTTTTSKPESTEAAAGESTASGGGLKVVFPKGFHKRLGAHRLTTPHTPHDVPTPDGGSASSQVVIKKGPPMRATTEFTGWPTPPTTPLSIDKLNAQTINFEDLLTASASSTTTTTAAPVTTTTTTTTTPRPTKPGHCTADCDLAATIKIIDGVAWKPELLDHNTLEWKNLAHELEAQLNDVYSSAQQLNKWYKKVRIDSFSKGSVLVDYYVELANITEDVDTLEIRQLFHDALTKPTTPILPDKDAQENETDSVAGPQEEHLVKASYQMGKYIIDPVATDFSVIAKNLQTNVEYAEEDLLIPQWAIVVIVIGVGSLVFVIIFGVTVLLNRQKRAKKAPIPLTNDMLNELKVNHMGGVDNYGVDDFYNIDDPWNDTKQPIKPKRFTNSMHGSNSSNIYDSWRSTRHPHSSSGGGGGGGGGGDYFYDQQPTYSQKGDSLKRPQLNHHHHHHQYPSHQQHQQAYGHQYPDAFADAHQMYSYNNHPNRTRYSRDYDPDF